MTYGDRGLAGLAMASPAFDADGLPPTVEIGVAVPRRIRQVLHPVAAPFDPTVFPVERLAGGGPGKGHVLEVVKDGRLVPHYPRDEVVGLGLFTQQSGGRLPGLAGDEPPLQLQSPGQLAHSGNLVGPAAHLDLSQHQTATSMRRPSAVGRDAPRTSLPFIAMPVSSGGRAGTLRRCGHGEVRYRASNASGHISRIEHSVQSGTGRIDMTNRAPQST